jgi:anaerobic magnesium-protoporphyrin IX monomethyl ester cyclase
MRVCLVTPPSPFLLDERVFPALGILKVAAVLEKAGHQVDHLDLCGVSNAEQVIENYSGSNIFGITATTPQIPAAVRIGATLRARGARTILGGPHPTLLHAAAKRGNERAQIALKYLLEHFDVVVAGDGEKAIFTALHSRGLVDADDPKGILWNTSKDFEESPWPARHLIDMDSYHYTIDGVKATSAIAQLGCPMHCKFCGGRNSPMLRQIRVRSSGSVVDEMIHLHEKYGVSGIMHFQDELNINHRTIMDLMAKMKETGIDWQQRGFVKAELFNEAQAEIMYSAGFRWLLCGFESGHPRILKNIAKNATREDNTRMLRTAHKHGIKVKALMSAGHPGESEETVLATRDWLLEEKPDDFDLTIITVYPGTPYFDESVCIGEPVYRFETNGDVLYSENTDFHRDMQYYKGAPGEYKSYVWTDDVSRERLCELRDEVEAEVRRKLNIPYPSAVAAVNFESSMGQGLIPQHILRSSN